MKEKKIVVALGGNALGDTPKEQLNLVKKTAKTLVDLVEQGNTVIVGHGNGPQVGMIHLAMEKENMPFPECGAMSQGYIGYHLQQAIEGELRKRRIEKPVVCLVTQVVVDEKDKAFKNPTKPIGEFLEKEKAEAMEKEKGYLFKEDAGRGYRRVVPSPLPKRIVEIETIKELMESGKIVIAAGGGGIPVIETKEGLKGIAAVIDKDRTCEKLAEDVDADILMILTAVDRVFLHFNEPAQLEVKEMNLEKINQYIKEGQFAPGSMLPKVEACKAFVSQKKSRCAYITSLEKAGNTLSGEAGTKIVK
ncbi:MAG: carbamate kinase [Acetivibrio sp.]